MTTHVSQSPSKKKNNVGKKLLLLVCCIPLLLAAFYCETGIHRLSAEREIIKRDYSDINSITYGLLSVDAWKENIEKILTDRIHDFDLTPEQRQVFESEITDILKRVVVQSDSMIQNAHSFKGKVASVAYKVFVNKDDILHKAPQFSHSIMQEIVTDKNKERMKNLALSKLDEYASQTFGDTADVAQANRILAKYNATSRDNFNTMAAAHIQSLQDHIYTLTYMTLCIVAVFLLAWLLIYTIKPLQVLFFGLSVTLALSVLLVGLTSPMIDIDARIKKIDFVLLGDHVQFHDQVLFYQSKSILQVVKILIKTGAIDSITVGILILIFSIVFPITKLIATQLYLFGKDKAKKNKLISFFAIRSGKWSMADVMVVAIFMAYVGFKGILDNQLEGLNFKTPTLNSISTNLTSLQPAFLLFLAFVIFGIILSEILKRISHIARKE